MIDVIRCLVFYLVFRRIRIWDLSYWWLDWYGLPSHTSIGWFHLKTLWLFWASCSMVEAKIWGIYHGLEIAYNMVFLKYLFELNGFHQIIVWFKWIWITLFL